MVEAAGFAVKPTAMQIQDLVAPTRAKKGVLWAFMPTADQRVLELEAGDRQQAVIRQTAHALLDGLMSELLGLRLA